MSFINSIFFMDSLSKIEQQVSLQYKTKVTNISHWDTSIQFQEEMLKELAIEDHSPPWNYMYTYSISIEERQAVMRKLGLKKKMLSDYMVLLLQSGTQAIINVANYIKLYKYKKVCILRPSYFSVSHCFDLFGIKYDYEDITFTNNTAQLPMNNIMDKGYDCLWITSPIFSTGKFYTIQQCSDFNNLLRRGMLIISDESFSLPGCELIRYLTPCPNLLSIYCPHKAISLNSVKFSAIICSLEHEDFLEQWVDVLSGALSKSNCDAIFHFLSRNFNSCYEIYKRYICRSKNIVAEILEPYKNANIIESDKNSGQYVTVFWKGLAASIGNDLNFFSKLVSKTKASFYPGSLSGFSTETLSFRINLTLSYSELSYSVSQIAEFLHDYAV